MRDRPVRLAGVVLACSTPISGFLSYAVAATLFGEDRLERSDGLTTAGGAAFAAPLLLGVVLVLWSFLSARTPDRRMMAVLTAVVGAVLFGVGLWSMLSAVGDASIGGGLLVLASLLSVVVAARLSRPD